MTDEEKRGNKRSRFVSFQRALKEFNRFSYKLKPKELKQNTKPLIKLAFSKVFESHGGLTDILLQSIPNPIEGAENKISRTYTGEVSTSSRRVRAMQTCDKDGPLAVQIVKLYPSTKSPDAFDAFGRVLSGTLRVNDSVKVLGEAYSTIIIGSDPSFLRPNESESDSWALDSQ